MKKLLFILIISLVTQCCFSQFGIIKGHVHDRYEDEGLEFAGVFLVGHNIKTATSLSGDFILDSIPVGIYVLKITYLGYPDTIINSIKVTKDKVVELYIDYLPNCMYYNKDKTCPECKKKNKVIPIVYGLPSAKMAKASKKGKIKLGGCSVSGCDPKWYCVRDEKKF